MERLTGDWFVAETVEEEYALLLGRVDALLSYAKNKYEVKSSDVMAILGYREED